MELKKELSKLKGYIDVCDEVKMREQTNFINENFKSEKDLDEIEDFMRKGLKEIADNTEELIQRAESILIREQLKEVGEIVSMSYIARNYFNKNRTWLYQKINGNLKNGKKVKFSDSEIQTFNFALRDISNKIGSIAIHS